MVLMNPCSRYMVLPSTAKMTRAIRLLKLLRTSHKPPRRCRTNGKPRDPLHNSSRVRVDRIGMGCKADFAANSTAIGKKFNAADRPSPDYHGP